jgi:hypothetical protein
MLGVFLMAELKLNEVLKTGGFYTRMLEDGVMFDQSKGMYPSRLIGYEGPKPAKYGTVYSTTYGYVLRGEVTVKTGALMHPVTLGEGQFFSVVDEFELEGSAKVALFERIGFRGINSFGGPIEERGRLAYIDGCSDSLLVHPPRLGDPCFNLLVFPENTRQTMHTHPSIRLGVVVKGQGRCVTPEGELPLTEGFVFCLEEMGKHCFFTDDSQMYIVAYHPDSDWGPTDENHPMLNRTLMQH